MRTVRIILLILVSISSIAINGQEKELKEAIKTGKKINFMYTAHPSNLTYEKFQKWAIKQNGYIIKSYKISKKTIYGYATDCVSEILFIPISEKEAYQKYLLGLEEKKRDEELKNIIATGAVLAVTGFVAVKALESIGSMLSSSSSSGYSSYSGSSISYSSDNKSTKATDEKDRTNTQGSGQTNLDVEKISAPRYSLKIDLSNDKWKRQNDNWDFTFIKYEQDSDGKWLSDGTLYRHKDGYYGWGWSIFLSEPDNIYDTLQNAVDAEYVWKKYKKIRKKGRK